jgi:hypothetical protein
MIFAGTRLDRCRHEVATASKLLWQLRDERRLVLEDPEHAHALLDEMIGSGEIDVSEVIDLMRNGEPDEAGRLPGEGELVVRRFHDPRIAAYERILLESLQRLRMESRPPLLRAGRPCMWRRRVVGVRRRGTSRRHRARRLSLARQDDDPEPLGPSGVAA